MKVAINKKYEYITLEKHCPDGEDFETWVMQDKFETHSVVSISSDVNDEHLRFDQFDYNEATDTFVFNLEKHNRHLRGQETQRKINFLESILAGRYEAHGRLLATNASEDDIEEVKDEIALILEELEVLYNARVT